jgi:hypothetical protein
MQNIGKVPAMELKDIFNIAAKTGDFPKVEIEKPLKHFSSNKGKIVQIRPDGVAVDFGGNWNPWFHAKPGKDKRCKYMADLKPTT